MQTKKPWVKGDKALLGAILAAVLLSLGGYVWWQREAVPPSPVIPTPVMPNPNAFDVFNAAARAVVQANAIDYGGFPGQAKPLGLASQEAVVTANAPALRLLRQGLALPYHNPPLRSFDALFPYYAGFRGLARLLTFQGRVQEQQGDWGGAAETHLDAVQMGIQIPRGGPLIGMLAGIACQAIGRRPLWADIPHLTAPQARAAARRMERISVLQVPYATTLQEEEWTGQASFLGVFHSRNWRHDLLTDAGIFGNGDDTHITPLQWTRFPFISRGAILVDYTRYMDASRRDAAMPYATPAPTPPDDPFSLLLAPPYRTARLKFTCDQTQNVLLTATLALSAYELDHGAYPATLTALVPRYLSRVPDDPFALSSPLRYKVTRAKYVLYSVGPDGRDDGGTPICDPAKPVPASRYWTQPDSTGDIVAGVNLF